MSKQRTRWVLLAVILLLAAVFLSLKKSETIKKSEPIVSAAPSEAGEISSEPEKVVSREAEPSKSAIAVSPEPQVVTKSDEAPTPAVAQFRRLVETAQLTIPKKKDLQALSEEQTHNTPELIQRAALSVGQIAQAIKDNEELVPEGLQFYRTCAESQDSPNSIRASCYFNHEELIKKFKLKEASLDSNEKIDARVRALAKKL